MIPGLELEDQLRSMLAGDFFHLHYQLQYYLSGEIRGMEALLRLPLLKETLVSPDRLIAFAEDRGTIHSLGKWVLEKASRQLKLWNASRRIPVRIAINLSPLQLMRPRIRG